MTAQRLAKDLRAALVARGLSPEDLFGPAPAFFAKRRDLYRWQIILRAEDPAQVLRHVEISAGWRIDIDKFNANHGKTKAYAIPCPDRRTSGNWVLNPVPTVKNRAERRIIEEDVRKAAEG